MQAAYPPRVSTGTGSIGAAIDMSLPLPLRSASSISSYLPYLHPQLFHLQSHAPRERPSRSSLEQVFAQAVKHLHGRLRMS